MIEQFPSVLALPTEQKELLAEELLLQVMLESSDDPGVRELLRQRLAKYRANPKGGRRWEKLRAGLLNTGSGAA